MPAQNRRRKRICTFALLLLGTLASFSAFPESGKVTGIANFEIPSWFKDSFLEIAEDAAEAGASDKQLLLFFHLNNCPYCARMLKENFISEPNQSFIQANFDCIEINIKGDREVVFDENTTLGEKALAEQLNVLHTPTIIFASSDNQPVLRINGYRNPKRFRLALDYVHQQAYKKVSFSQFSAGQTEDAGYQFRDHPAFSSTNNFQTAAKKPLAVVFEDAHCEDCNNVHDTLFAHKDVRAAFDQLTVVRVDASSGAPIIDVDGNKTSARNWVNELNITYRPGVILFDRGKEIARIDNRLYSWHFSAFVKWVAGRHYEAYPDVFEYMAKLREARLARGEDVNYVD